MIPLLSPKPFAEFSPTEFHTYVKSLYVEPPVKVPPAEVTVRLNAKGTPVITVRREPKVISREEAEKLATEAGWSLQAMWLLIRKRKIQITVPEPKRRKR